MIVTCPACSARYKILEAKIPGRGAKITCPRCSHRFVFYREDAAGEGERSTPDNVGALDFSKHGVLWRVRKGNGKPSYEFRDLNTLREYIQDGQVAQWDQISADEREWTSIDSIPNLDAFFWSYWQRLKSGELTVDSRGQGEEGSEEDDSDAPTTIVGRGSSLASEIRQAVQDAATPRPVGPRSEDERGELVEDDSAPAKTDTPSPVRKVRPDERNYSSPPMSLPPDATDGDFVSSGPATLPPFNTGHAEDDDEAEAEPVGVDEADRDDSNRDDSNRDGSNRDGSNRDGSDRDGSDRTGEPRGGGHAPSSSTGGVGSTGGMSRPLADNSPPPVVAAPSAGGRPAAPPKPISSPAPAASASGGLPVVPLVIAGGFVLVLLVGAALYAAGVVG